MLEFILPALLFVAASLASDKTGSASFGAVMLAISILILRFGVRMQLHGAILETNNSLSITFSILAAGLAQALIVMFVSLPLLTWICEQPKENTMKRAIGITCGVALMLAGAWASPHFEVYLFAEWLKESNLI